MFSALTASIGADLLLSTALVIFSGFFAYLATKVFSRQKPIETKRILRLTFRNIAMGTVTLGLFLIWRSELQSVLVALGAATAGLFVALREAWLSLLAFWIRVVKRHYVIGDFIEVDGIRGKVVDITWQHTVLAETGAGKESLPFSGRQIQIPNNRLLLAPIFLENRMGDYTAYVIVIPLPLGAKPLKAEALLLQWAEKHCEPFKSEVQEHMTSFQKDQFMDTPSIAPKCTLLIPGPGLVTLHLRIVVPAKEKLKVEQAIVHDFFANVDEASWPAPAAQGYRGNR